MCSTHAICNSFTCQKNDHIWGWSLNSERYVNIRLRSKSDTVTCSLTWVSSRRYLLRVCAISHVVYLQNSCKSLFFQRCCYCEHFCKVWYDDTEVVSCAFISIFWNYLHSRNRASRLWNICFPQCMGDFPCVSLRWRKHSLVPSGWQPLD